MDGRKGLSGRLGDNAGKSRCSLLRFCQATRKRCWPGYQKSPRPSDILARGRRSAGPARYIMDFADRLFLLFTTTTLHSPAPKHSSKLYPNDQPLPSPSPKYSLLRPIYNPSHQQCTSPLLLSLSSLLSDSVSSPVRSLLSLPRTTPSPSDPSLATGGVPPRTFATSPTTVLSASLGRTTPSPVLGVEATSPPTLDNGPSS